MPRRPGQKVSKKTLQAEQEAYARAKRERIKKRPDLSVYASPEELAAFRAGVEARKLKAVQRKAAHQERLTNMTEEERALYDAKALRKTEGRQRWLEEYRTLDKKTEKERRDAKKKAAADRKNIREGKRELRAIRRQQIDANRHTKDATKFIRMYGKIFKVMMRDTQDN